MATRRKQNIWPFGSRATSPRNVTPASGGIAARAGRPSVSRRAPATRAVEWKGFQIVPDGDGFRVPAIDPGSLFDTAADAKRFISDEVKLKRQLALGDEQGMEEYFGQAPKRPRWVKVFDRQISQFGDGRPVPNPGRSIEKVSAEISKLVDAMNLSGNTRARAARLRALKEERDKLEGLEPIASDAWGHRTSNPGASYRGMSVAKLESIRPHVAVLTVDNDWLVRDRGRRELEKVDHALELARKREQKTRVNITDRAKRYRAQANVPGPRKCVICGSKGNARKDGGATLDVMHLTGNESHGERENLAYGCRSCNTTLAHAFKAIGAGRPTNQYNPAAGHVPTFEQYLWAVSNHSRGAHDEGGAVIHATPRRKRIEYAQRIAGFKATRQRAADDERWNPAPDIDHGPLSPSGRVSKRFAAASKERARVELFGSAGLAHPRAAQPDARESLLRQAQELRGLASRGMKPRAYMKQAEALEARAAQMNPGGAQQAAIWQGSRVVRMFSNDGEWWTGNLYVNNGETITGIRKSGVKRATLEKWAHRELEKANRSNPGRKRNPADAAAAGFEMFHGSPSSEVVEVTEQIHYHKHLSSAGELKELQIQAIDGKAVVKLSGFGGSLLTFNEKRNQLFVTGGDQEVDLQAFGINPKRAHELETLGALVSLDYFTDKKHLGAEGGAAIYRHKLRTTNENGRHITVKLARYPDVVYRVPEKRLEFSGGSYEILPEGINL